MRQTTWTIDNLTRIGGHPPTIAGKPRVAEGAVLFDGTGDGLYLDTDPLEGLAAVTVEALFRPDTGGATEQRFVHIQENASEDRIMLETRVTADGRWYGDTYIQCGQQKVALFDSTLLHPLGQWQTLALACDGRRMIQYVNGVAELEAPIQYSAHGPGRTAIGSRLNRVYFFRGAIKVLRFSEGALEAGQLLRP